MHYFLEIVHLHSGIVLQGTFEVCTSKLYTLYVFTLFQTAAKDAIVQFSPIKLEYSLVNTYYVLVLECRGSKSLSLVSLLKNLSMLDPDFLVDEVSSSVAGSIQSDERL